MAEHKPKRFRLSFVNAAEDVPRLILAYGRACFGEFALVLRPTDGRGVLVRVTKDGAWMWKSGDGDAPVLPESAIDPKDAVTLVKTEQKGLKKDGPITLRGQWSGYLHCDDGTPRVEVTRKLAAYGVLRISSSAEGWTWTVERTEKWFSTPGSDSGSAATLSGAIGAGLARAMHLLGEACSTRDSHRRAALDDAWATEHPIRPAKEGKDPTERLRPKEPRRTKAAVPPRMDAPVPLPDPPATAAGVKRMAEEVAQEADALGAIRDVSWVWHDSTAVEDALHWFREVGLHEMADDLALFDGSPDHPAERAVARMRTQVASADLDEATRTQADAVVSSVEAAFRTAPYLLERARRLVRHAARLTETELCRGRERKEAADAIQRAVHAYDEARAAVTAEDSATVRTKLRSTVEWAALGAAKAARACAAGQTALPTQPKAARKRPATVATEPEAAASSKEPPKKRLTRRRMGSRAAVQADAEKDKLLLDAFRDAVTAAMSEPSADR